MAFLNGSGVSPQPQPSFDQQLRALLDNGFVVQSDGPSGVQLAKPKKMRLLDKLALAFGILTLVFYGLGLVFILLAALDYAFFTKPETKFLART